MTNIQNWNDPSYFLRQVHVAEEIMDLNYTREIIERAGLPVTVVPEGKVPQGISEEFPLNLRQGKQHLFLCQNKGNFFKPCPATTEYRCCDYQVLNIGANCPIDCVYCILQAYLNNPWITAFVNVEKMFAELNSALRGEPDRFFRIGTGEFTDSLALERITGISKLLIEFLADHDNVILELKTKSASIDSLQHLHHKKKTVLSWSLNSPAIMKSEEIRAAQLQERLKAAKLAAEWGYKLSFHFDPIIYHKDWQQGYAQTIKELFSIVPKEAIVWISLGCLRYLPALKPIATTRFPHSNIFFEEFIVGLDNKSRYFRKHREEMYRYIIELLQQQISPSTCLYLCMESDEIWQKVFGFIPEQKGGIPKMLDEAAITSSS